MQNYNEDEINQRRIWNAYANRGYLQSTIDPNDIKGLKCDYIDLWSKYYIKKQLDLKEDITVLEVGCGSGRNLFSLAPYIKFGYGVDVSEKQIANARKRQKDVGINNLLFLDNPSDLFPLKPDIDVLFTMWVLQGFQNDLNLIEMLKGYIDQISSTSCFVFFEQIAEEAYIVEQSSFFYKKIRTYEDYFNIFNKANLQVIKHKILNEKGFGFLYRLVYMTSLYEYWPKWLNLNPFLFHIDKFFTRRVAAKTFTDSVFLCEKFIT